jgi:hypothetical protein
MARSSFIRYTHLADVLTKTSSTNDVGQKMPTWSTKYKNLKCFAVSSFSSADIRVNPTIEQAVLLTFYVPYDIDIDFSSRVQNIRFRKQVIFDGFFEVDDIKIAVGYIGKPQYKEITLKQVIE